MCVAKATGPTHWLPAPTPLDSHAEQVKLHSNGNWFDLALLTIKPQNNKSFLMRVIPRMAEGYKAKYITGSGESIQTKDRVLIFRVEGDCEPIKRAPRNRSRFGRFGSSRRASKRAKSNGMNRNKRNGMKRKQNELTKRK